MFKVLFISKYATFAENSKPSRQYFISSELAKSGMDVMLVGSRSVAQRIDNFFGLKKKINNENLTLIMMNGPTVNYGFSLKRILSWVIFEANLFVNIYFFRKFKPDIIIVSSLSILTVIFGIVYKKIFSTPLVLEIRDIYPRTLIDLGGYSERNIFVKMLSFVEKAGYRHADLIISPLENLDSHAEKTIGRPVNFKWIPMGSDSYFENKILSPSSLEVINYVNKEKDLGSFVIGYAGSHGQGDCLDQIISAAEISNRMGDNIKYVFIGNGPEKKILQNKYAGLSNVVFFNEVPKKDVVAILKNMSLLINIWINVGLYQYGLSPNKWIDYSMSSRPFVINIGASLKIVKAMKGCVVIKAETALQLRNEILKISKIEDRILNKIGEAGRLDVLNKFSYSFISKQLGEELIKLCRRRLNK